MSNNINDRIVVDENEVYRFLETSLDKLQPIKYDSRYRMLLGDDIITKLTEWENGIRRQKDVPLTVVVCGEFKRGKSSFLNAFLGEDVVTTNITTETITVNRISYGEHSNELVLEGGKRIVLTDEELKCDNLKAILAQISATEKISMLEIKRPIEILKNVTFIDTPGLGDSIKDFTKEVNFALRMADAVVYVFSALYPLSMQEQFFIKTAILPQKYTELFLVSSFCDTLEEETAVKRVENTICERIGDILPGEAPYMISSIRERKNLTAGDDIEKTEFESYLDGNFEKLRFAFSALLESKRKSVIPDRISRMISAMIEDLGKDIENINTALSLSTAEYNNKKSAFDSEKAKRSEEFKKIVKDIDIKNEILKGESVEWLERFVSLLEKDTDTLSGIDINDIKKYYSVFCVDAMQEAINKCSENYIEKIYSDIDNISSEITKNISMSGTAEKINFRFDANTRLWTKGDNLNFWGTQFLGSNIIVDLITGSMREKELKNKSEDVISEIKKQFPTLRSSVLPEVSANFTAISEEAKKALADYFAEKNDELDNQMTKASEIVHKDEEKKKEIKAAADTIGAILEGIRNEMKF